MKNQVKIINYNNKFRTFRKQAKGKSFVEQLELWNEIIEKDDKEYFDNIVFAKDQVDNWIERKNEKAQKAFQEYDRLEDPILSYLDNFDSIFLNRLDVFKKDYPDVDISNFVIRAMVSLKSFVGMSDRITDDNAWFSISADFIASLRENNTEVNGIDFIMDDNILYSHEIMHMYQGNIYTQNRDVEDPKLKFMTQFWSEGLANFYSQTANPGTNNEEAIGIRGVESAYATNRKRVHGYILKDIERMTDDNFFEVNSGWWALRNNPYNTPFLTGYAVSRQFVESLSNKYGYSAIFKFNIDQIKEEFLKFLTT